jgi:hypothetical protein
VEHTDNPHGAEGFPEDGTGDDPWSDPVIQRLKEALEIEERRAEVSLAKIRRYRAMLSTAISPNSAGATQDDGAPSSSRRVHTGSQAHKIRLQVARLLREMKRPLSRAEILDGLVARGFEIKSQNPAKRISKIMWESDEFQHLPTGYWLSDSSPPGGDS